MKGLLILIVLCAFSGVAQAQEGATTTEHFGAPFTIEGDAVSLTDAIANCTGTGEACKVQGTVDRVCTRRGCWFTVADPAVDRVVRIQMQDYGFFVPLDCMGAQVVFEGLLTEAEVSQEMAQHFAEDEAAATGEPARVVEGPEQIYQFMITGVDVTR